MSSVDIFSVHDASARHLIVAMWHFASNCVLSGLQCLVFCFYVKCMAYTCRVL